MAPRAVAPTSVSSDRVVIFRSKATGRVSRQPKKMVRCTDCSYQSDRKHNITRHYQSVHKVSPTTAQKCCGTVFAVKQEYWDHLRAVHAHGYTCSDCRAIFTTRHQLTLHMGVHDPSKNRWCTVTGCGYNTSRAGNFLRHLRTKHRNIFPSGSLSTSDSVSMMSGVENDVNMAGPAGADIRFLPPAYSLPQAPNSRSRNAIEADTVLEDQSAVPEWGATPDELPRPFRCELCGAAFTMMKFLLNHKVTH